MEMAIAAYRLLVAVAQSDGGIGDQERELLERYHCALGLDEGHRDPSAECPDRQREELFETRVWRQASVQQRAHLLRMLARVACADGKVQHRERRLLKRVARRLGISRLAYVSILVEVEDEVHRHGRGLRLRVRVAVLGMLAITAGLGVAWLLGPGSGATSLAGATKEETFREIEASGHAALLLIQVDYELRSPDDHSRRRSTGTGFFICDDGLIVTNKHVLEPWKFTSEAARMVAQGYTPVEDTVRVVAYPVGTPIRGAGGQRLTRGAFDTREGTLRVLALAPDHLEPEELSLGDGRTVRTALHANDSNDLALLQATSSGPVSYMPLRPLSAPIETLEPVLVMGFPDGTALLERGQVHPTVALGEVSRAEETILVQAPLLSGSSGGPVLDAEGRVVGVATRKLVGASYARCIQAQHLHALCRELDLPLGGD